MSVGNCKIPAISNFLSHYVAATGENPGVLTCKYFGELGL